MKKILFTSAAILVAVSGAVPALAAPTEVANDASDAAITFKKVDDGKPEENNGPLKINDLQDISFGENFISGSDARYAAQYLKDDTRSNYIQVKDDRGTNKGWTLRVSNTPFEDRVSKAVLTQATLDLTATHVKQSAANAESGEVIVPLEETAMDVTTGWNLPGKITLSGNGAETTLIEAKADKGMGYTNVYLGEDQAQEAKNKKIELFVPGTTKKLDKATYTSTLTWALLSEPSA